MHCSAALDTPAQRAFTARTIAARGVAQATHSVETRPSEPLAQAAVVHPAGSPPVTTGALAHAREWLEPVDAMVFIRVGTYAYLAAAVFWFFGIISGGTAGILVCVGTLAFALRLVRG